MIFGKPDIFAISFDVVDVFNDSFCYGTFNIIVNDVFFPAAGSNYTLTHIVSFFHASADELKIAKPFFVGEQSDEEIAISLARQYGHVNKNISDNNEYYSEMQFGVDLSPLEVLDKGVSLCFFDDENCNGWLMLVANYGELMKKIKYNKSELIELLKSIKI